MEEYNPIVPSSLFEAQDPSESNNAASTIHQNFSLKSGVIVKTYDIDNKDNISKISVEYDVMCFDKKSDGSFATTLLKRCLVMEQFGSVTDFFEYKMRNPSNTEFTSNGKITDSDGSLVLVLCLNGDSEKGIIIGSVKHPARKTKLTKDNSAHLEGEYNGLNWKINKDGELVIKFNSATDNKGKVKNTEAQGSYAKFDKDGNINIGTQIPEGGKEEFEYLHLSKKDKKAKLRARETVEIEAKDKDLLTSSGGATTMKVGADLLIESQGRATVKANADFEVSAGGNMNVKASSVMINSNSSFQVQASNVMLNAQSVSLGVGGTPAVTMNTLYVGIDSWGGTVVSQAVGGFSGSVLMGS